MASRLVIRSAIALGSILLAPGYAWAQEGVNFFAGKNVTMFIGTGPGGGYDIYGRLVARHYGRQLSPTTQVVPQNMPGAASLVLSNYLYNKATRDGTAVGMIGQAMHIEQRMAEAVAYDTAKMNWIGRVTSATELGIVWHTSTIQRIEDTRNRVTIVGGTGHTSSTDYIPMLLNNLAGTKFKVVTGFPSSTAIALAMERGEVEGSATPWETLVSFRADWLAEKKIRIILQWTAARDPDLPDVPALPEMAQSDEGREILKLWGGAGEFGRSVVGPPGIPGERVTQMRRAFDAMLKDPQFLADAGKLKMPVKPATGEALQQWVGEVAALPGAFITKADQARKPK